jgi:hypothetical protein
MHTAALRLGLRENLGQFSLLVLVNATNSVGAAGMWLNSLGYLWSGSAVIALMFGSIASRSSSVRYSALFGSVFSSRMRIIGTRFVAVERCEKSAKV